MTADLVTLSGDYAIPMQARKRVRVVTGPGRRIMLAQMRVHSSTPYMQHGAFSSDYESMAGIVDFGKSVWNISTSSISSVVKGTGHTFGEIGRGVSRGDWTRVALAPVRGGTHVAGSMYRDVKQHIEWYYRPSKMRQWMKPAGAAVTVAGSIPTIASPILLAGGAALTAGGAIGESLYQKDQARKAAASGNTTAVSRAREAQKKNLIWYGVAGAIGVTALVMFV